MKKLYFSAFTMLACIAVFCSLTFAYFTDEVSSNGSPITTASYSLAIADDNSKAVSETYICPLTKDDRHTFTLTANGSADTGFCKIEISNEDNTGLKTYYTTQIFRTAGETNHATSITLTIQAAKGSVITFTPQWGTSANYSIPQGEIYGADETAIIHSNTPYYEYTIVDGAALSDIAQFYGVAEEDICVYNGITDLAGLTTIKIPGTMVEKDYSPLDASALENKSAVSDGDVLSSGTPVSSGDAADPAVSTGDGAAD